MEELKQYIREPLSGADQAEVWELIENPGSLREAKEQVLKALNKKLCQFRLRPMPNVFIYTMSDSVVYHLSLSKIKILVNTSYFHHSCSRARGNSTSWVKFILLT